VTERPYVIGLTGNIATGKSMVGQMLAKLGAEHVDADLLAHEVMASGAPAWEQIVAAFGPEVVAPDGEIDRHKLGAVVFADAEALARLERIVHPTVIERTRQLIDRSTVPVLVIEAIKLIESGMVVQLCDTLWVVIAPRDVQIERLMSLRGMSRAEAALRVDAQPSQETKVAHADVVIDNGGTRAATREQVERAWSQIGARGGAFS
jgi:dephospho-CoA kinase